MTGQAYVEGDQVVARRALVAPPVEAWGVGVEIPSGTRGRIIEVRSPEYRNPYIAQFEIGDLEICVADADIGLLYPAPRREPVPDRDPVPAVEPGTYVHLDQPHRWCRVLHGTQFAASMVLAGLTIGQQPLPYALLMTGFGTVALLCYYGDKRKRADLIALDEEVHVNEAWVSRSALTDVMLTLVLTAAFVVMFIQAVSSPHGEPRDMFGMNITTVMALLIAMTWASKWLTHGRATDVVVFDV